MRVVGWAEFYNIVLLSITLFFVLFSSMVFYCVAWVRLLYCATLWFGMIFDLARRLLTCKLYAIRCDIVNYLFSIIFR